MALDPCAIVDVIADVQLTAISEINKKFFALQRLAALIEQLGDISIALPDLGQLFPISEIDLNVYTNLRAACPFLGLPDPGEAGLLQLQALVVAAYGRLIRQFTNHPFLRLDALQDQFAKAQAKFNDAIGDSVDFLACLQQICNTAEGAGQFFANANFADIQQEVQDFTTNVIDRGGQILTTAQDQKVNDVRNVIDGLNNLIDTPEPLQAAGVGTIAGVIEFPE